MERTTFSSLKIPWASTEACLLIATKCPTAELSSSSKNLKTMTIRMVRHGVHNFRQSLLRQVYSERNGLLGDI